MKALKIACSLPLGRKLFASQFKPRDVVGVRVCGISFPNPVGLGAGFDKNALYLRELKALGFGFVEIGTVTPRPQEGNAKPRLFRLPKDSALINRMGFNNEGVDAVRRRLKAWRQKEGGLLIGGNIGKNKDTPNEAAVNDYEICFNALHPYVDFFVVNVSSPNTPGLRALQEKDALKTILTRLQVLNRETGAKRPILLKIAPDLTHTQVDDVIALSREISLDGLVVSNTTISREGLQTEVAEVESIGAGGLSGKPLRERSTSLLQYIHGQAPEIPLIGSGGIFKGEDAREKLNAGASLVEVWTGFIYEGPSIVRNICRSITRVEEKGRTKP